MSINELLTQDMKDAMRQKEAGKVKLSVIRMVKSAAKYLEIEKGRPLSDEEMIEVISRELKQRREVLPEYENKERWEMVETLKQEMDILITYLPQQLSPVEVEKLIKETIATVEAKGIKDMGKVMGLLNPQIKGKADGRTVSEMVKAALSDS